MVAFTSQAVYTVAKRTNLSPHAVTELLNSGWTYVEDLKNGRYWVSPESNLKI